MEQVHELITRIDCTRNENFVGFASKYLERFDKESKSDREIDREIYSKLVQLDSRLGTKASDQLYKCLSHTTRSDIIKDINKV